MGRRLPELCIPVFQVLMDDEITKQKHRQSLDLNDTAWKIIKDIVSVLNPFAEAKEPLTPEGSPTLSQLQALLLARNLIIKACNVQDDYSKAIEQVTKTIKGELITRVELDASGVPNNMYSPAMVASFLDPCYKALKFHSPEEITDLTEYVTQLAEGFKSQAQAKEGQPCSVKMEIDDCLLDR